MREMLLLEEQRCGLAARVAGWSRERVLFRPSTESWCAAAVFQHLLRTEEEIRLVAAAGIAEPHAIGVRDRLGYAFLDRIFRSERKVKVPSSVPKVLPEAAPELPMVLGEWEASRVELGQFVEALLPEQRLGGIFRHPVGGWMNVTQILGFFSVHMTHHAYQIARLEQASAGL